MAEILQLATPNWAIPLLEPSRYKGAWGGRGSGKSHLFAELMIEMHIMDQKRRSVCVRVDRNHCQTTSRPCDPTQSCPAISPPTHWTPPRWNEAARATAQFADLGSPQKIPIRILRVIGEKKVLTWTF